MTTPRLSCDKAHSNNSIQFQSSPSTPLEDIEPSVPWSRQCRPGADRYRRLSVRPGSQSAGIELTATSWKSDRVVRLLSGGEALRVIGTDNVGSVICRPLGSDIDICVPPSLLVAADLEPDAGASGHPTQSATENA